jgi:heme-degrading monooxygenase HmoA
VGDQLGAADADGAVAVGHRHLGVAGVPEGLPPGEDVQVVGVQQVPSTSKSTPGRGAGVIGPSSPGTSPPQGRGLTGGPAGNGASMSVVKINAISVPKDKQERFEERFKGRAGAVESTPGFEWFELLRPLEGTDQYLVYTRWESEEAYRAWESGRTSRAPTRAAATTWRPAASDSHHLWSYEVIESAAPDRP